MIRTLLIDDEPRALSAMRNLLGMYCPELQIVGECRDAKSAREQIVTNAPQLVFLDISMPGDNGLELLRSFSDIPFEIIFATAHDQYAVDAFRFSAVDYLIKPVDEDLLVEAVSRAVKRIEANAVSDNLQTLLYNLLPGRESARNFRICLPSARGFKVIESEELLFCEGYGAYTKFFLVGGGMVMTSHPISEYETMLAKNGFFRIHKSYLVNLWHIKEYVNRDGGRVVLKEGHELDVSRRQREAFLRKMNDYFST